LNIIQFIEDHNLINDQSLSHAQKMSLKAVYGLPLDKEELKLFRKTTGLRNYVPQEWEEASFILGRRSGKSDKIASNIALYEACSREHKLSKGAIGVVMLVSSELKRQSRILYSYILHKIEDSPILSNMIQNVTSEEITLDNGVIIQVYPCNVARIRGASLIAFIADEVAFWKYEGRDIDVDVLDAARPGLSFPYSKMIKITSPYMMKGEIYNDFKKHFGQPNKDVLVFHGSTKLFNPSYSKSKLKSMKSRKPIIYQAEYMANFRKDMSSMYDPAAIERAVNRDRPMELPPEDKNHYRAFADVAGGSGKDSFAIAIGHLEDKRIIIDVVRSRQPKFNPDEVTSQYCELLKQYSVYSVQGYRYSGDYASNSFAAHDVTYEKCEKTKSELYIVEDYTQWRQNNFNVKKKTVNMDLRILSKMLNKAVDWNHLKQSQFPKIEMLKNADNKRTRVMTGDEEERLLKNISKDKDYLEDLVLFAVNTGMRKGEILKLKWEHISFGDMQIHLPKTLTKNSRERDIPINSIVRDVLERRKKQEQNKKFIFTNSRTNKPFVDFKKSFSTAC